MLKFLELGRGTRRRMRIGIVGCGIMAHRHMRRFKAIAQCKVVAAADVHMDRAAAFARRHGLPQAFDSLDSMLKGAEIDAVSIVTPDASHARLTLAALAAGKHVFCEKPLATECEDADAMARMAAERGLVNMVNFTYRDAPALQKARDLIRDGIIGSVVHVEASYLQSWLTDSGMTDWRNDPTWLWRLSTQHGSRGVLGDLGVHILDFVTFAAGEVSAVNCRVRTFEGLKGSEIGGFPLDANDSAVLHLELAQGGLGVVHVSRWASGHSNSLNLRIFGDRGAIAINLDSSWRTISLYHSQGKKRARWRKIWCGGTPNNFNRFVGSILSGVPDQPDFAQGAAIQRILEACEQSDRLDCTVRLTPLGNNRPPLGQGTQPAPA